MRGLFERKIQQYNLTTINHSLLKGDVTTLWEGIYSYSKALTITNSWIEDAHIVANLGNTFTGGTIHDGLYVDNVVFNKNYNAIATSGYTMDPGAFRIKGSIFTCKSLGTPDYTTTTRYTSIYNPATKGGVKIKGSTYYSITNNTIRSNIGVLMGSSISNTSNPTHFTVGDVSTTPSVNTSYTNRFDYLNEGIVNSNGKLNIYNNGFSNIISLSIGTSLGAVYHLSWGGYASTNVGSTPSYYKNVFGVNCTGSIQDGVAAVGGGSLNVSYNDFCGISRYGVNVQSWNAPVASTHTVLVTNNSFSTASYAFYANNNQTITASITSNTLVQTQPTYTNTGYGVYINEVNKPANANYLINLNNFSQGLNSVYITNTKNARVIDNLILIKKPSSTSIFNGGVVLDNDENTFIKGNTISCNPTNSSSWNTFGIYQSASIGSTLKCNTIYSVSACIKAQSSCSPTTMYYNSLNKTNGNDPCFLGLWLDQNATFGDIGYKNGSTWEMSDDIWGDFSTADTKCQVSSNPNTSPAYKIYYDNSNTGPKPLSLYQPQVNLNTYTVIIDISQSFTPIVNNTTNSQGCSETSRVMNPSPTNPGKNAGTISHLNDNNVVSLSNANENADNLNDSYSGSRKKQIILKTYDPNGRVIAGNEDAFWVVDSLMTLFTQTKNNGVIASAISRNASINALNGIEQNQKDFNAIYCVFLQGDSLVGSNQIQDIKNMAALCPYVDGFAVYQARGLIRSWDDSTHYYNACENSAPDLNNNNARFTNNKSSQLTEIIPTVYPNPTNGNLVVNSGCKNCIFEVYDIIGKKVLSQRLNENETKVDLNSLNNGTYLYKIVQDGVILKADKLLLNK